MKIKSLWFRLMAVLAMLLPAIMLFAQEEEGSGASAPPNAAAAVAIASVVMLVVLVFAAIMYIYMALALQTIAKKTNTPNGWWAWIPIIQVVLALNIAKKPMWWLILCLIPLVNIVIGVIVSMAIAEARNKPSWWGILTIVPVVGIIVPGYLAWSE